METIRRLQIVSPNAGEWIVTMLPYDQVLKMTRCLNLPEQLKLLVIISRMVRDMVTEAKPHSIMELEGLGADIWQDVDAQAYVAQERDS